MFGTKGGNDTYCLLHLVPYIQCMLYHSLTISWSTQLKNDFSYPFSESYRIHNILPPSFLQIVWYYMNIMSIQQPLFREGGGEVSVQVIFQSPPPIYQQPWTLMLTLLCQAWLEVNSVATFSPCVHIHHSTTCIYTWNLSAPTHKKFLVCLCFISTHITLISIVQRSLCWQTYLVVVLWKKQSRRDCCASEWDPLCGTQRLFSGWLQWYKMIHNIIVLQFSFNSQSHLMYM